MLLLQDALSHGLESKVQMLSYYRSTFTAAPFSAITRDLISLLFVHLIIFIKCILMFIFVLNSAVLPITFFIYSVSRDLLEEMKFNMHHACTSGGY